MREALDALQKQLLKFAKVEELEALARRLFQKLDGAESMVEKIIEENPRGEQAGLVRQFIMNTVMEAVKPRSNLGLPRELEEYVAFVNLQYVIDHKESFEWNTFLLQDYPPDIHEEDNKDGVPIPKFRRKIKKNLTSDVEDEILASVHFDVDEMKDPFVKDPKEESEMTRFIMIRILTTAKVGRERAQKNRMLFGRPAFFAYVPGEPYVYVNTNKPNKRHFEAIVKTLACSSYVSLPLKGHHLPSLRRMRLNRDAHTTLDAPDFYKMSKESSLPTLETFKVSCVNDLFTGVEDDVAQATPPMRKKRTLNVKTAPEKFECSMEYKGIDVLNGFSDLCDAEFFEKPYPNWISKAIRRGRNTVDIRWRKPLPLPPNSQQSQKQDDLMSIAGTEL